MSYIQNQKKTSWRENYFLKAFFLGLGLSFAVFLPFLIVDGGRFLFYGDFNVQQVPFYRLAHDAVRSGNLGWSHLTDLGANFIGSYSFYLLGSPFFWLTIPFPSEWLQFLMGPLLILKFACASLTGYVYIHRYTKSPENALIAGLLYAFSGFSVYNIFFNHFHEAIVFFPLLLAALDEYMATRCRGIFALAVFACCVVNYYFFVGQVTFTLIYFFLRLACGSWRISLKDFLLLGLEAVIGVGLSAILLVPSILAVLQNNRVDNVINGWNAVLYNRNQRYMHIMECFFFPPDLPARPNFTPDSESKWSSLGAWLPLFGMTGVIGWLQLRRKHWLKKMLWILFAMALIPGLNASFQMLNRAYYARWYYMLTLMMALATVMALEEERTDWRRSILWTFSITAAISCIIGFMPFIEEVDGEEVTSFGLEEYPSRFWTYVAIALISLGLVVYLFTFCRRNRRAFQRGALACLSLVSVFYSIYFIALGKTQAEYTWDHLIPYALNGGASLSLPDLQECRSDFYESMDNAAMFWQIPSIQAFHSIVPGSVMDFYDSIGVQRDVGSRPKVSHYPVRALTSVHWLFDDDDDPDFFAGENSDEPSMPGWAYYGNANGYDIWENGYYIRMGFSYDYYMPRSEYEELTKGTDTTVGTRELAMLRALVVDDADVPAVQEVLSPLSKEYRSFSEKTYGQDCLDRSRNTCSGFQYTNSGFQAYAEDVATDTLYFFSVPYEPGWRAQVNGEPVEIIRSNIGFMSIVVPTCEVADIQFIYTTPGLGSGILITACSLISLIGYLALCRRLRKPQPPKPPRLMKAEPFAAYCKKQGAAFRRPHALRPHFGGKKPGAAPPLSKPPEPAPPMEEKPSVGENPSVEEESPLKPAVPDQEPHQAHRNADRLQPRPWPQRQEPLALEGEGSQEEQKNREEENSQ